MQSKKILVTGGAGFLSSHLCERLLENGDEMLCVDNLFRGYHFTLQIEKLRI